MTGLEVQPVAIPDEGPPGPVAPPARWPPWRGRAGAARRLRWGRRWAGRHADLVAATGYLLGALYVAGHLLRDPAHRVQRGNIADNVVFQFALAHGAHVLRHGGNPFFSTAMNVPSGVNMMANTSILGLSVPLAPVTLLFGPAVSFAVLTVLALAGTAFAWYFLLARHLVQDRAAAALGGLFCGFAPGMVSQDVGHPNIAAQFLIPLIIWRASQLRQPGRAVRNGVLLGLLTVWQAFINEEILLIAVLGYGLFLAGYCLMRRDQFRAHAGPVGRGLLVAVLVAVLLLAYPLAVQFLGPQHYRGLPRAVAGYGTDLAAYPAFSSNSLGGRQSSVGSLAQNAAEENAFLGWPLLILVSALVLWLRRAATVLGLALVAVVFAVLSVGPTLTVRGHDTGIPGPFALVRKLPLADSLVPTRLALGVIPVLGVLLAIGYQRVRELIATIPVRETRRVVLGIWVVLLLAALVPLVPRPLAAVSAEPAPAFLSAGTWRRYVGPGQSVVTAPLASIPYPWPLAWSAQRDLAWRFPGGYFLGPSADQGGPAGDQARFGAPPRPTSTLLTLAYTTGRRIPVNDRDRALAREDLRFWRAGVVVLVPGRAEEALWRTITALVDRQPDWIGGAWVWDVRALTR